MDFAAAGPAFLVHWATLLRTCPAGAWSAQRRKGKHPEEGLGREVPPEKKAQIVCAHLTYLEHKKSVKRSEVAAFLFEELLRMGNHPEIKTSHFWDRASR